MYPGLFLEVGNLLVLEGILCAVRFPLPAVGYSPVSPCATWYRRRYQRRTAQGTSTVSQNRLLIQRSDVGS